MKSKLIIAILSIVLINSVAQAKELSSLIADGNDSVTYTADSNNFVVDQDNGRVAATIQTTFGKPSQHGQFLIKFYVARVTLDCKNFSGFFVNIDAYEGDPSTTKKVGTLVTPEPFKDGNGRGFLNKDIFTKVCQEALPQSQQAPIVSKKSPPESSASPTSSNADYCFTSVKNLNSCNVEALIASNAHLGSIHKFVNNRTSIQTIILNPKPLDLSFFKPGSPAYEQALKDRENFVPTRNYVVKFKLNGNTYEEQVGPNSNCYYQGLYKEDKESIEFDFKKYVGSCTEKDKLFDSLISAKSKYRKIYY